MGNQNKIVYIIYLFLLFTSCKKIDINNFDPVNKIKISDGIYIDNSVQIHDSKVNLITYEGFLKYLVTSNHFMIVTQKDFPTATSTDKVIISLRYDLDDDINNAVRFAYREHKFGIKSTYYVLHTANYYGVTSENYFKRNDKIKYYLHKIQNDFGQEIGWHNDLVTLQIVYNLDPKEFLRTELSWLRSNGINIFGTVAHGSEYCYVYHYLNSYFWKHSPGSFGGSFDNWEFIPKNGENIKIEKDDLSSYNLEYDGNLYAYDYFYADCDRVNGELWHMGMVNFDTIQPGKKVIILLHPQYWK